MNLTLDNLCALHDTAAYPQVCREFTANREMCGLSREHAIRYLSRLESETRP